MKQLTEDDILSMEHRKAGRTRGLSERHPLILSAVISVGTIATIAAVLWSVGVAQ